MDSYMNSYLVSLIVIALYLAYALLVLSVRGLVVRGNIYQGWARRGTHYPRSATNSGFTPVRGSGA
jgi:hypothetical protein